MFNLISENWELLTFSILIVLTIASIIYREKMYAREMKEEAIELRKNAIESGELILTNLKKGTREYKKIEYLIEDSKRQLTTLISKQ